MNFINGSWRNDSCVNYIVSINKSKNDHPSKHAEMIRDTLADHFIEEGQIHGNGKYLCGSTFSRILTQKSTMIIKPVFACSKTTTETLEQGGKYVQSPQ